MENVPVASRMASREDPAERSPLIFSIMSRTYVALALATSGSIGTTGSSGGKFGGGARLRLGTFEDMGIYCRASL